MSRLLTTKFPMLRFLVIYMNHNYANIDRLTFDSLSSILQTWFFTDTDDHYYQEKTSE